MALSITDSHVLIKECIVIPVMIYQSFSALCKPDLWLQEPEMWFL